MKNIISELNNKLPEINNQIPNINCGCCGIFASILGEKLENMGYKPKYFIFTKPQYEKLSKTEISNLSLDDICQKVPPTHVVIALKGYYIDSNGCRKNRLYLGMEPLHKGMEIQLSLLKKYISVKKYWNTDFNRKNIKKIRKQINNIDKKSNSIFYQCFTKILNFILY